MRATLSAVAAALIVAGCGADPDYYLLPPPAEQMRLATPADSLVVMNMSLPAYAEAIEIATVAESGAVELDQTSLWADTPQRALTRHLVATLQQSLDAEVAGDPWPGFQDPDLRLEVVADRFIGAIDGSVVFSGQYLLVAPESGAIVASERFNIYEAVEGAGYQPLLAAHARAVETLAVGIARRISGLSADALRASDAAPGA
jgi:uncharacterized protein